MSNSIMNQPDLILVFSGKRKSGKDFICSQLAQIFKSKADYKDLYVEFIALSAPLKELYAKDHGLEFEKLLDSSEYKEMHRLDMINWSDSLRAKDSAYFCRKSVEKAHENSSKEAAKRKKLWIVTDARRKTDLDYFKQTFPNVIQTVRVIADESVRAKRGWVFKAGVDNTMSECDLDSIKDWNFLIVNNSDDEEKTAGLQAVLNFVNENL